MLYCASLVPSSPASAFGLCLYLAHPDSDFLRFAATTSVVLSHVTSSMRHATLWRQELLEISFLVPCLAQKVLCRLADAEEDERNQEWTMQFQ